MPHFLHAMVQIKLELLQEIFGMQLFTNWALWEMIFPVLLRRWKYLQKGCVADVLEKLKYLVFEADPRVLPLGSLVSAGVDGSGSGATSIYVQGVSSSCQKIHDRLLFLSLLDKRGRSAGGIG